MGYDVSTTVFYGVEIEKPDVEDMNELYAECDMHFVMPGGANGDRYFVVRADTFKPVAVNTLIENDVIDIGELIFAMSLEGRSDLDLYVANRNLTTIGNTGWFVVAWGS